MELAAEGMGDRVVHRAGDALTDELGVEVYGYLVPQARPGGIPFGQFGPLERFQGPRGGPPSRTRSRRITRRAPASQPDDHEREPGDKQFND